MKYLKILKDIIQSILFSPIIFIVISLLLLILMEQLENARVQNILELAAIISFITYFIALLIKDIKSHYPKHKGFIILVDVIEIILIIVWVYIMNMIKNLAVDIYKWMQYSTYLKISIYLVPLLRSHLISLEEKLKIGQESSQEKK